MIAFQEPAPSDALSDSLAWLEALGWVDRGALLVLLVCFVLGLFKGLIWQVSRIGILIAAYFVAGSWGHEVADWLRGGPMQPTPAAGAGAASDAVFRPGDAQAVDSPAGAEAGGGADGALQPDLLPEPLRGDMTLYVAYALLFLAVLIVLSVLAILLKKLADRAGLGFFDRLGGGLLGIGTGACVVLALVFLVHMFFPASKLAEATEQSHSLRWSQRAVDWLGRAVDDDLRTVLLLERLEPASDRMAPTPVDASGTPRPGAGVDR